MIRHKVDPGHTPRPGDKYVHRVYGVVITVRAVGKKDGVVWVVFGNNSDWRCKEEMDHFRKTHRRFGGG